ncbi:RHS repeat-associated core domain-containing protein [Candidatus Uhrbacteria bacterium]|nr:RHS repeat-associated core domain-containing protein [Candidatus Uhrbacteria bacterium]
MLIFLFFFGVDINSGTGVSSTVSSILTDHLTGSNIVTDASGAIIEASDYYPYGAIRIDDQTGFNEQRKFAGHEYDADTGMSYMRARYYNGNFGRFVSQDPVFLK